jgi:hypothetical protein
MGVYLRRKSYYIDFYYEGKRYTEKVGPVSKSVAEEKLDIKRREVIRGEWKPKKVQISFEKFKEEYLELTKGDRKPKSVLQDECSLKHLSKVFKGKIESSAKMKKQGSWGPLGSQRSHNTLNLSS